MLTLLDPWFWAFALAVAFLLPLTLGVPRSIAFGVLNLVALHALLGWTAPAFVLAMAAALWLGARGRAAGPTLAAVAVLFVLYKLAMERGLSREGLLFPLLTGIGFSYVFLRAWDFVVTMHRGNVGRLDPVSLAGYLAPFHMLSAGPIGGYAEHAAMDTREAPSWGFDGLLAGLNEITSGLFYKFVVAEGIRIFAFGVSEPLLSRCWFDTALLFVYVFFDFAGYSLVAQAIGRLSGVPTPVNFVSPFSSTSVTEFWTRWHMSLGSFVRRNLYLPMQLKLVRWAGTRRAHLMTVGSLVLSFAFVGLWHRLCASLLVWGVGMGAFLALEKLVRDHVLLRHAWAKSRAAGRVLRVLGPVYVFLVLTTSIHFVIGDLLRP